jgi:HlyD family secretion protein
MRNDPQFKSAVALKSSLAFALAIAACMAGCGPKTSDPAKAKSSAKRVETAQVERQHIVRRLETFGSLEPIQEVQISARVAGKISELWADEGDPVKKGARLFSLDDDQDKIALKRAAAELEKATQAHAKLAAGSRPEDIEAARTRYEAAKATDRAAKDEWERVNKLITENIGAASELVKARANYDVTQAMLSQAKARLDLENNGARVEDILAAKAEMNVRAAAVEEIERRLREHLVVAPASGVIAGKHKEAGEWIDSGETAFTLLVLDPMRLRVEAPQSMVGDLAEGLTAKVTVPGMETETFEAVIRRIIPQARTDTRNFPVILQLDNPDGKLAAGMYARIELDTQRGVDALLVPRESVQYREQELVVYKVVKGEGVSLVAKAVYVRITQELDRQVVVESVEANQIQAGDEVVAMGGTGLKDGDQLERLE